VALTCQWDYLSVGREIRTPVEKAGNYRSKNGALTGTFGPGSERVRPFEVVLIALQAILSTLFNCFQARVIDACTGPA
jgi:hypothetical protein